MARQSKKRKFSNNQPVVFRFGARKLIGKVVFIRPIGKQFMYDVLCEDGKVYSELGVDSSVNQCIDTYLTRLFYRKYSIDENSIPDLTDISPSLAIDVSAESLIDETDLEESETLNVDKDDVLFEDEDLDPNY